MTENLKNVSSSELTFNLSQQSTVSTEDSAPYTVEEIKDTLSLFLFNKVYLFSFLFQSILNIQTCVRYHLKEETIFYAALLSTKIV